MRIRSKKGISLVELIAVCAISVMVIAAACALLYAASKSAARGTAEAAGHGDAHLLETYLQSGLPTALSVGGEEPDAADGDVTALSFGDGGELVVETNGGTRQFIDGIQSVTLSLSPAGGNGRLSYSILAGSESGSYTLSGGIVLNNVRQSSGGPWTLAPDSGQAFYFVKEASEGG